jgi:ABC-type dipeptide/oligopeptide/nickel transport system ATPase component
MTAVDIPDLALVALVGISGSGKSTFARRHFRPTQVLSSDFFRGLVADDENDQSTRCTTSPASGSPPGGSPSSTPPTCSRTPAPG